MHVWTDKGEHRQLLFEGNASKARLAPDNETLAWLKLNKWKARGGDIPGFKELVIYRNGKFSSIKCTPFIRDYWFWQNGGQIAIDCGGQRFAGREILYDARTLKELSSFYQAEVPLGKRPDWSNSDD